MNENKQLPLLMGPDGPPDGVHDASISGILTRSCGLETEVLEQVIVRCQFENYRDAQGQRLEQERSFRVPSISYDALVKGLEGRDMPPEEVAQVDPHVYEGRRVKVVLKQPANKEAHFKSPMERIFGRPQPRTGRSARDVNPGLNSLMGTRCRFRAIFKRNGTRKNYNGYLEQTFCFEDIRLQATGERLLDHVWFRDLLCLRKLGVLATGDQIEFDARVGLVKKGYRGPKRWARQNNPPREGISLLNPTKMVRLPDLPKETFENN